MRPAGLLFLFLLLAGLAQAQQYKARQYGIAEPVPVPLIVEKAFHQVFPAGVVDSCDTYSGEDYEFDFKLKGLPKQATFDARGKLTRYVTEVALDTLPRRVQRTFNEYYLDRKSHVGGAYDKYQLKQGYATIHFKHRYKEYEFVFDVVARGGREFLWSVTIDEKGEIPNPKFR